MISCCGSKKTSTTYSISFSTEYNPNELIYMNDCELFITDRTFLVARVQKDSPDIK
jgi:hypothetical protein